METKYKKGDKVILVDISSKPLKNKCRNRFTLGKVYEVLKETGDSIRFMEDNNINFEDLKKDLLILRPATAEEIKKGHGVKSKPTKPLLQETVNETGEFCHYRLIDPETGDILWSGDKEPKPKSEEDEVKKVLLKMGFEFISYKTYTHKIFGNMYLYKSSLFEVAYRLFLSGEWKGRGEARKRKARKWQEN